MALSALLAVLKVVGSALALLSASCAFRVVKWKSASACELPCVASAASFSTPAVCLTRTFAACSMSARCNISCMAVSNCILSVSRRSHSAATISRVDRSLIETILLATCSRKTEFIYISGLGCHIAAGYSSSARVVHQSASSTRLIPSTESLLRGLAFAILSCGAGITRLISFMHRLQQGRLVPLQAANLSPSLPASSS